MLAKPPAGGLEGPGRAPGRWADRQAVQGRRAVRSGEGFKQGRGLLQGHFRKLTLAAVAPRPGPLTLLPLRGSCVCLPGRCSKAPQTKWCRQQKCMISPCWRPEAQDHGVGRAMLSRKAPEKDLAHGILPVRVHISFYKGVSLTGVGFTLPQYDFI